MDPVTHEFEERLADLVLEFQGKGAKIDPNLLRRVDEINYQRCLYRQLTDIYIGSAGPRVENS